MDASGSGKCAMACTSHAACEPARVAGKVTLFAPPGPELAAHACAGAVKPAASGRDSENVAARAVPTAKARLRHRLRLSQLMIVGFAIAPYWHNRHFPPQHR